MLKVSLISPLHVLAIVKTTQRRDELSSILESIGGISAKMIVGDVSTAWKDISADKNDSIILLEIDEKDQNIAESLHACKNAYGVGHPPFILISSGLEHDKMLQLVRVGVSDFLPVPLTAEEVKESITRMSARHKTVSDSDGMNNKIITFAHASGGMGTTTLAVNAATIINAATQREQSACLMDFDLQFGGASVHLDLPGYSPVMDLLSTPERLDREMLEGMMMRHSSGLRVFTTPEAPLPVEAINSEIIERLLKIAQKRYKYIIVDMPQTMTLWTDTVFKQSKVIYIVMQMNVPSIRQLRRWFSVLEQEGLHNLPIKVVVNRHTPLGPMRHDNITMAQASEALGRKIDFAIPNDYDLISQSLDQGMPAATVQPKSKFVSQLKTMLHEAVDEIELPKKTFFGREI